MRVCLVLDSASLPETRRFRDGVSGSEAAGVASPTFWKAKTRYMPVDGIR